MSPKREIKASEIVPDIQAGMNNLELMEKYRLSPDGLRSVFTKLIHAKIMAHSELEDRIPLLESSNVHGQIRQTPRVYPEVPFPIYDMDNMEEAYFVRDVSKEGLQVAGINVEIGRKVTFLIQALAFDEVEPFTFDAECRWTTTSPDAPEMVQVAGFEITDISAEDFAELQKLVGLIRSEVSQPSDLV